MNKQPTFGQWLPISLMVGVLAGFSIYLTQTIAGVASYAWVGAVWVLFISWGGWFSVGAKLHRLLKYIVALTGGTVLGWLTLVVNNAFFSDALGPILGLSVSVFLAATIIVLLELTDWFELAFIYFLAYASYFAFTFGGFAGDASIERNAVLFWILLMAGLVFALVNVWLKNILFKVERVPLHERNTIFDKE